MANVLNSTTQSLIRPVHRPILGAVAQDIVLPAGVFGGGGGGGSSWLPSELSGLDIWVETDISTLFQDSAKTTPVTAENDPVGAWADKSGNGNDFIISSAPDYRPQYKPSASAIRADGTDEYMYTPWVKPVATHDFMFGIAFTPREAVAANSGVLGSHTISSGHSSGPSFSIIPSTGNERYFTDTNYRFTIPTILDDQRYWVVRYFRVAAGNLQCNLWANGVLQAAYGCGASLTGDEGFLHLFASYNGYGQVDVSSFVMASGQNYTDEEAASLSTYMQSTLPG